MTRGIVYDTRAPLYACEHKTLNRQIGIHIQEPFFHKGLEKPMVDVEHESITVNTNCFGQVVDANRWPLQALKATEKIISDIDRVIAELQAHKERMQAHHEVLSTRGIPAAKLIRPRSDAYLEAQGKVDTAVKRINTKLESYPTNDSSS